jgi:hypothetical protein
MVAISVPSERHYRYHILSRALALAFFTAFGAGTIVGLIRPGSQASVVLVPTAVFLLISFALGIALRGRRWLRFDPEDRIIQADEWVRANTERARRVALMTVWLAQGPLMFFVAYIPPDPTVGGSVTGMAGLTMALAGIAFFGSYLVFSRVPSDG